MRLLYVVENLGSNKKRRVIVNEEDRREKENFCHNGIDGMHLGRDKTYAKVYPRGVRVWFGVCCMRGRVHVCVQSVCVN